MQEFETDDITTSSTTSKSFFELPHSNNPGKQIKAFATIIRWIEIALFTLTGLILIAIGIIGGIADLGLLIISSLSGAIIIALGWFVAWLSCIFIYAFGELVENSTKIANDLDEIKTKNCNS